MLKVATAFSGGFGSTELALKYLGIEHEVVFACEWADPQRKSYIQNHGEPASEFYKDIRQYKIAANTDENGKVKNFCVCDRNLERVDTKSFNTAAGAIEWADKYFVELVR